MNKKIPIVIGIAVVAIGITIVGVKSYFGDAATELPQEESVEKTLNLQESGNSKQTGESGETSESTESGESGGNNPP